MREETFPRPVSDPAAEGLPEVADDDSHADESVDAVRVADGPSPAPLPAHEPLGADRWGTTAAEARRGEPLAQRLAAEEPDAVVDEVPVDEQEPVDDEPESLDLDDAPRPVGRLVQPDEGAHPDEEAAEVAYDAGPAGGGPSAEEAAMHEHRPR